MEIQVSPEEATVTEGESVTMRCQVTSNPPHWSVSWFKDGTQLEEQGTTLTLPEVTRMMSGQYTCQASNDVGLRQSDAVDLQVHCEPPGSCKRGRLGVSRGATQAFRRGPTQALRRGPIEASAHPTPLLGPFFQMLQNLPGFSSPPRQLKKELQ